MFVIAVCYTITSPVLIELSKSTHKTIEIAGYVFSFYFIGFITGCYLSIWLITYWNRKNLLLTAYFLLFVAMLSLTFTSNFILIAGLFILIGLANGFAESQLSILIIEINLDYLGIYEFKRNRPPPKTLAVADSFDDYAQNDYIDCDYSDF